jgi:hypothetical protein
MGQINSGSFLDETISGPSQEGSFLQGQFNPATGRTNYGAMDFAMNNTPYPYPPGLFPVSPVSPEEELDEDDPVSQFYQRPYEREATGGEENSHLTSEQLAEAHARLDAAKQLGYTDHVNPIAEILKAVVPGSAFMMDDNQPGTVTPMGNVIAGDGRRYNPITGAVASGSIMDLFSSQPDISPASDGMGVSPASIAGLMTVKGNNSIHDLLNSATGGSSGIIGSGQMSPAFEAFVNETAGDQTQQTNGSTADSNHGHLY